MGGGAGDGEVWGGAREGGGAQAWMFHGVCACVPFAADALAREARLACHRFTGGACSGTTSAVAAVGNSDRFFCDEQQP